MKRVTRIIHHYLKSQLLLHLQKRKNGAATRLNIQPLSDPPPTHFKHSPPAGREVEGKL